MKIEESQALKTGNLLIRKSDGKRGKVTVINESGVTVRIENEDVTVVFSDTEGLKGFDRA